MKTIKVIITSFIDEHQPGFVECKFYDAFGKEHVVHEKVPVVAEKYLDASSEYPQKGIIACEILKELIDEQGRKIFTVDTSNIWGIDTIEGISKFDLFEEQLAEFVR